MTDEVVLRALVALDEVSLRELEVAGERLSRRRDGLQAFGQVFADVANERDGGVRPVALPPQERHRRG